MGGREQGGRAVRRAVGGRALVVVLAAVLGIAGLASAPPRAGAQVVEDPPSLLLDGTVRDFRMGTPRDFECPCGGFDPNIVKPDLGADGKPVYRLDPPGTTGTTSGRANFDQWYRDVPDVNLNLPLQLQLDRVAGTSPPVYRYSDGSFFPATGLGFGNEGHSRNYSFTFELHTEFTYSGGERFTFVGDDDVFVFINKKLAIDLGGIHGAAGASVNLDDFAAVNGMTAGGTYQLDLFFAERHTVASSFTMETTLKLRTPPPEPEPPVVAVAGPDQTVPEGSTVTLDGSASEVHDPSQPTPPAPGLAWQVVAQTGAPISLSSTTDPRPSFTTFDEGTYTFRLTATSGEHAATDDVTVTVTNQAPVITRAESDATATDGLAEVTAAFTDAGIFDQHAITYDWGDGSPPETVPAQVDSTGWGYGFAGHRYATTGPKTVTLTVADVDGGVSAPVSVVIDVGGAGVGEVVPAGPGAALWATATTGSNVIKVTGSNNRFPGRVHTNRDLRVSGSGHQFTGGTEYVTSVDVTGSGTTFTPAAVPAAVAPPPFSYAIADWRPGGSIATALGSAWHNESASCSGGNGNRKWQPSKVLAPGVYYVNCGIQVSGSNLGGNVTFVAEGPIKVSGSGSSWTPYAQGLLFLSGATDDRAVDLSGSGHSFHGSIFSATGGVELTGSGNALDCGIVGTVARVSGSNNTLGGANCAAGTGPGQGTKVSIGAPPLLVPTISHTLAASAADAQPGDVITYADTIRNGQTGPAGIGGGAHLYLPVELGVDNPSAAPVTLNGVVTKLEVHDPVSNTWSTLATTDPAAPAAQRIASLTTRPNPAAGVSYPTTGNLLDGTVVPPGLLASWSGLVTIDLTPEQVRLLMDPARVDAIRPTAELATSVLGVRKIARFDDEPLTALRQAPGGDLVHAHAYVTPGSSMPVDLTDPAVPDFATIAPGQAATATTTATVPVPAAKAPTETDAAYLSRLRTVDGHPLVGAAHVKATATPGDIWAPQQLATTTRHLPVVTATIAAPGYVLAGDAATWTLTLTNTGSAPATGIDVVGTLASGGLVVGAVPATLAPGEQVTVTATAPTPGASGTHAATFVVTWSNAGAPDHAYGPITVSGSVRWATASQPISISRVQGNFYVLDPSATSFTATPASTPVFAQQFPNVAFNPPANVVAGNTFGIDPTTTPFTDVTVGVDGTATGTLPAQSGPHAAGVGALADFQAVLAGTLTVDAAGPRTLSVIADDGFTLGLGGGATRVSGPSDGTPATTPFQGLPVMGGHNANGAVATYPITVSFPGPGTYAFEIDYLNHAGTGTLVLAVPDTTATGSGKVFLTGHDPDFHSQHHTNPVGAQRIIQAAIGYVTGGTTNPRVLLVSDPVVPDNRYLDPKPGLVVSGFTNIDQADAGSGAPGWLDLHTVDFTDYDVVVVSSDHGGVLRQSELDLLNARKPDLDAYLAGGGGLVAFAEGSPDSGLTTHDRFAFAGCPDSAGQDQAESGFTVSPLGAQLGLTDADFNGNFAHNYFTGTCGLESINIDSAGRIRSLATPGTVGGATQVIPPAVELVLSPAAGAGRTGEPFTVRGTVTAADHQPIPGVSVSTVVTGTNPQVLTGQTDGDGVVRFTWTGGQAGIDVLRGSVSIPGTPTVSNQATVTWSHGPGGPPGPDPVPGLPGPTVGGCTPADGATVTAPTTIACALTPVGTTTVSSWTVTARPAGTTDQPVALGDGSGPDLSVPLDPTTLTNGIWTVTITAVGSDGGRSSTTTSVVVDGSLKLGRFSQSFQDLSVPVGGIPIHVTRTYDSLARHHRGDFGYGWDLSLSNFRVQTNVPLGRGEWTKKAECIPYPQFGLMFWLPCYENAGQRFVTVTWPDGRTETFDFSAPTTDFFPNIATAEYKARAGATSTLTPAPGDGTYAQFGGTFYTDFFSPDTVYAPTRFVLTAKDGTQYLLDSTSGLVSATDRHGNTVTVDDDGVRSSLGPSITWHRDDEGRIDRVDGPTTHLTYTYTPAGDLETITDPMARTTTAEYEADHLLHRLVGPGSTPLQTVTYHDDGRVDTITDVNGHTTTIQDDPNARTEIVSRPDHRGFTRSTYDLRGNPVTVEEVVDGVTHTSTATYDGHDLPTSRVDANGNTWSATYDDQRTMRTYTDANGRTTTITPNDHGQPRLIQDSTGHSIEYTYDDETGDVLDVRDADLNHRTFTYDDAGNVTSATYPGQPVQRFTSTAEGRRETHTDGLNRVTTYGYDADGRLKTEQRPEGTVTYGYDADGLRRSMTGPAGTTTWTPDDLGRIRTVTSPEGTITYDWEGTQRRSMTTPTATFTYGYDDGGALTSVTGPGGTTTLTPGYVGLDAISRPNGVTTTYAQDLAGRVTGIRHADASDQTLASFVYTLDPNGNRVQVDQTVAGQTWTETYGPAGCTADPKTCLDQLGRLTDVTYGDTGATQHHELSPAGNRTSLTLTGAPDAGAYTYHLDGAQQLTSIDTPTGTRTLGYDGNGNQTSDGAGSTFAFDSTSQLVGTGGAVGTHAYTYNPDGLRVRSDGTAQLWDQCDCNRLPVLVGDGATTQTYAGELLLAQTTGGATTYPLGDALDSNRLTTDASGTVVATQRYDVYGASRAASGPTSAFGFTGQQTDPTGLVNLRARFYQPSTGRFLSPDSVQPNATLTTGLARYAYATTNPMTETDASGHGPLYEYLLSKYYNTAKTVNQIREIGTWTFVWTCVAGAGLTLRGYPTISSIPSMIEGCLKNVPKLPKG